MQVMLQLFLLLSSVFLTYGADPDAMDPSELYPTVNVCNETVLKEFDECWKQLPQAQYQGIPSNPKKIAVACSVFTTGMECVNTWSKKCLSIEAQEMLNDSIIKALHIYQTLCTDTKFRAEYHQHMGCFNRVSSHWDACNNIFIRKLERIDNTADVEDICCARAGYIQCVNGVVRRLCTKSSSSFLITLNMFLTKSTLETHTPCKCTGIFHKKYRGLKSASQYATKVWRIAHFFMYYAVLIYYQIL